MASQASLKPLNIAAGLVKGLEALLSRAREQCPHAAFDRVSSQCSGADSSLLSNFVNAFNSVKDRIDEMNENGVVNRDNVMRLARDAVRAIGASGGCTAVLESAMESAIWCYINLTLCPALPRKVASFASLSATYGISTAMSFYISKADRGLYGPVYHGLQSVQGSIHTRVVRSLSFECSNEGETVALALVVRGMEALGVFAQNSARTILDLIKVVAEAESEKVFQKCRRLILDYMTFLKRFIDGLFG